MSISDKTEELITYSRVLYERKLLHATGGNTSVRDGDAVLISQTGAELGNLSREEVVRVDLDGKVLAGKAPSKEMGMHLAMYRARPDAGAVIHAHPTFAITHSAMLAEASDNCIPPFTAAFYVRAGRVPLVPFHGSGAHSLHQAVEALAPNYHALLLRQHGMLVAGADMAQTLGMVEEIEQCCQISVVSNMHAASLTDAQLEEIDRALGRTWKT
ncbi:MAG: class II aldolase/adducin family protein [Desulfofustis sp.]